MINGALDAPQPGDKSLNRSLDMTPFRKLWNTFVDAIKPPLLRENADTGLHAIVVDTRPFHLSVKGR